MASAPTHSIAFYSATMSDAKVRAIASIINLCERTTISMEREVCVSSSPATCFSITTDPKNNRALPTPCARSWSSA